MRRLKIKKHKNRQQSVKKFKHYQWNYFKKIVDKQIIERNEFEKGCNENLSFWQQTPTMQNWQDWAAKIQEGLMLITGTTAPIPSDYKPHSLTMADVEKTVTLFDEGWEKFLTYSHTELLITNPYTYDFEEHLRLTDLPPRMHLHLRIPPLMNMTFPMPDVFTPKTWGIKSV